MTQAKQAYLLDCRQQLQLIARAHQAVKLVVLNDTSTLQTQPPQKPARARIGAYYADVGFSLDI
jgi:hypothetical protein